MPTYFVISIAEDRLRSGGRCWDQLPDAGGWRPAVGKADLRRLARYWLDRSA